MADAIKATVDNLKLLGKQTTQHLIGPRGYRQQEEGNEDEEVEGDREEGGVSAGYTMGKQSGDEEVGEGMDAEGCAMGKQSEEDAASCEATQPRWRGIFKLAKHRRMLALDAHVPTHGAKECARAAAALKRHGETLSYPLSSTPQTLCPKP